MAEANANQSLYGPRPEVGARLVRAALPIGAVGAVLSLIALVMDNRSFSHAYMVAFLFFWGLTLGSLFFVALHHLTGAVWSVVFRRVSEMLAMLIFPLTLLFVPILVVALPSGMFPWMDSEYMHSSDILEGKLPYLNLPFFLIRAVLYFVFWLAFTRFYLRNSLRQDTEAVGDIGTTQKLRRGSIAFMMIFPLPLTFAAFDWIMSLQPHFFSTIFGVYIFAGAVASSLAALILAVLWLEGRGMMGDRLIKPDHIYSLGCWLFAFSCFWGYIAMSQYLLIWYANMPEETFWFVERWGGAWTNIALMMIFLRFVIPFLGLLSIHAKRSRTTLFWISLIVLLGQLVDLYWLVIPAMAGHGAEGGTMLPSWQLLGSLLFIFGVVLWALGRFLSRNSAVAAGDPLFEKSRDFHL